MKDEGVMPPDDTIAAADSDKLHYLRLRIALMRTSGMAACWPSTEVPGRDDERPLGG